jgi:protein SCO1/2
LRLALNYQKIARMIQFFKRYSLFLLSVALIVSVASCQRKASDEKRYELKGRVVSVDVAGGTVVIDHAAIPDLMEAMTMSFPLPDKDVLQAMEPGNQIQATLVVSDGGKQGYRLENPIITKALIDSPAGVAPSLEPKPGDAVPAFSLINQDGKRISLKQEPRRALLVTFIYTRCPLADQCPLMSSNFAQIEGELEKDTALWSKTHLLSITLDPEYDRPEVLRSYGAGHTQKYSQEKFDHWEFATGEPAEIRRAAEFFGVIYTNESGQITHSLRTAIISPDGHVHKIYRGNEWKPSEVIEELKAVVSS